MANKTETLIAVEVVIFFDIHIDIDIEDGEEEDVWMSIIVRGE